MNGKLLDGKTIEVKIPIKQEDELREDRGSGGGRGGRGGSSLGRGGRGGSSLGRGGYSGSEGSSEVYRPY